MHEISQPDQFHSQFEPPEIPTNAALELRVGGSGEYISEPPQQGEPGKELAETIETSGDEQPSGVFYPQFEPTFTGGSIDRAAFDRAYASYVARERDAVAMPQEAPLSDDEWTDITAMHGALIAVGDELGVDLRDRLPKRGYYHMFDSDEAYREDTTAHFGKALGGDRGFTTQVGIFMPRREPSDTQHIFAHETAHFVSNYRITAEVVSPASNTSEAEVDTTVDRVGYIHNDKGHVLDEVATEMVTGRVNQKMLRTTGAYLKETILCNGVVYDTATHHKIPPQEVKDTLMRGLLNGDQTGVNLIRDALGEERAARFLDLNPEDMPDINAAIAVAKELQLPDAVKTLESFKTPPQKEQPPFLMG